MALAQAQQVHVQFVQQAALLVTAHHALDPEETCQPVATCHRFDLVQAGAGVQHRVTRRQFDGLLAVGVGNAQFSAVVLLGVGEEHRARHIGAHPFTCARRIAYGAVDVVAIVVALAPVAVEPGREQLFWQCSGKEGGTAVQRLRHHGADGLRRVAVVVQLLVVFHLPGLLTRAQAPITPRRGRQQGLGLKDFLGCQDVGQVQEHGGG